MTAPGMRLLAIVVSAALAVAGPVVSAPADAAASARVFAGSGFGNIADAPVAGGCPHPTGGAPRDVTFAVTGMPQRPLTDVRLTGVQINHDWAADITATLIAPNGASVVLFSRTGATTAGSLGDGSNTLGPYTFADTADPQPSSWWAAAIATPNDATPIPAGTYRASAPGGAGGTGEAVPITSAFASVTDPNGTWTLRLVDICNVSLGLVSAASLSLTPTDPDCTDEAAAVPPAQQAATASDATVAKYAKSVKKASKAKKKARQALNAAIKNAGPSAVLKAQKKLRQAKAKLKRAKARLKKAKAAQTQAHAAATAAEDALQFCLDN